MGVYVTDGVLLGVVLKPEQSPTEEELEELEEKMEKVLKEEKVDPKTAFSLSLSNNPYSKGFHVYLGIFWRWSERRALSLDDDWQPLFKEMSESEAMLAKEENKRLQKRLYELLKPLIPNLKINEVKFYEARFYG